MARDVDLSWSSSLECTVCVLSGLETGHEELRWHSPAVLVGGAPLPTSC